MKRWALVTIVLYAAVLVGLIGPVAWAAFGSWVNPLGVFFRFFPLWLGLGLMVLCQAALLALPVRLAQRRPVTRIPVFWSMLAAAVMFAVLAVGMGFAVWEVFLQAWNHESWTNVGQAVTWSVAGCVAAIWFVWAFAFAFYMGRTEPQGMIRRAVHWLIAGSILELLVAIPAHVYARCKDHCCGGVWTVWGLAAGIAVMLFAFGPGVFLLFTRRLRSIRPRNVVD